MLPINSIWETPLVANEAMQRRAWVALLSKKGRWTVSNTQGGQAGTWAVFELLSMAATVGT